MALQNYRKIGEGCVDFVLVPLIIFFSFYTPYFASGQILALDEGQHLAAINELLRGGVPFRDIFVMHGPLVEYIPYWLMKVFGVHVGVLRGFYLFANILSLVLAFMLLRAVAANGVVKYSALYLMLRYSVDPGWITRWGGIRWAPGFGALILLYFWLRDRKYPYLLLAGALCGIGLMISQDIGIGVAFAFAAAFALVSLESRADGKGVQTLVKSGSGFALGFAAAVAPLYCYLIIHRVFTEYLRIQFIDTLFLLTRTIPYAPPLLSIGDLVNPLAWNELIARRSLAFYGIALAFGIILVWALIHYRRRPRHAMIFLISLMAYAFLGLMATMRNLIGPQFNAVLPTVFITLSMFVTSWLGLDTDAIDSTKGATEESSNPNRSRFKSVAVILVVAAILLSTGPYAFIKKRISTLWSRASFDQYVELDAEVVPRARGVRVPWNQALNINGAARFLRENTREDERIFTFPFEGHINFLADRQSASRFIIALCSVVREEYMKEIVMDLESNRPKYIVYLPTEFRILGVPNEQRLLPIWQYIQMNYESLANYGSMKILVRRSPERTGRAAGEQPKQ